MNWDYSRCVAVLSEEIDLLKKISLVQDAVRKAVMAREWAEFDAKMIAINQIAEEFSTLEAERMENFTIMKDILGKDQSESDFSFYSLVSRLPPEQSRELSGLYRELKMETLRVNALNETFLKYLKEIKTMATAWLEAVFPVQGGKLYTCKGSQASGETRSVILNHRI